MTDTTETTSTTETQTTLISTTTMPNDAKKNSKPTPADVIDIIYKIYNDDVAIEQIPQT